VSELWLRYFALGGHAGLVEVDPYLHGLMPLPELQHNMLAVAVNERLAELPPPTRAAERPAPYVERPAGLRRTALVAGLRVGSGGLAGRVAPSTTHSDVTLPWSAVSSGHGGLNGPRPGR
jgi:hypothetical protein